MALDSDPAKVTKYVALLTPGFLALGFATFVSDFDLTEYQFTYTSLILSLAIYFISKAVCDGARLVVARRAATEENPYAMEVFGARNDPSHLTFGRFAVIIVVTLVVGGLVASGYENKWLLQLPRIVGLEFWKDSHLAPSRRILRESPLAFDARLEAKRGIRAWYRVHVSTDEIFEGFPRIFPTGEKEYELFLSPACRLTRLKNSDEYSAAETPGPGLLLLKESAKFVLLVDEPKSPCCKKHYGEQKCASPPAKP